MTAQPTNAQQDMQDQQDTQDSARNQRHLTRLLMGIGVAAFGALAFLRAQGDGGVDLGTYVMIAVVVGVVVAAAVVLMKRGGTRRHDAVVAQRPGADVREVWGAAGLRDALVTEGVTDAPVRRSQGTSLTLVTSEDGFELWGAKEPRILLTLPWTDVVEVGLGTGVVAADGPKPAVVVLTARGAALTILPARKRTGSLLTAPLDEVRATVDELVGLHSAHIHQR